MKIVAKINLSIVNNNKQLMKALNLTKTLQKKNKQLSLNYLKSH